MVGGNVTISNSSIWQSLINQSKVTTFITRNKTKNIVKVKVIYKTISICENGRDITQNKNINSFFFSKFYHKCPRLFQNFTTRWVIITTLIFHSTLPQTIYITRFLDIRKKFNVTNLGRYSNFIVFVGFVHI